MKIKIHTVFSRLLIFSLLFGMSHCKKADVDPTGSDGIAITDPSELSKVMIIPGATLEKGTPPPVTNTPDTPRLSTSTPEVNAISGMDGSFSINYSNVSGTITVIYIKFDGADSYFKIPISGNSGTSGQITIPMRIPEKYVITPASGGSSSGVMGRFCCFAATANAREVALCNNNFSSNLPPRPGKGAVNIGGRSYEATAVCDLDLGGFGKGYGILFGNNQFVALYNLRQGSTQLVDIVNSNKSISDGVPCALYLDGSNNIYGSVAGSATYNGKVVSISGRFEELTSSQQISVSASGNCQ